MRSVLNQASLSVAVHPVEVTMYFPLTHLQLKKVYSSGDFAGCLCDADVWNYIAGRANAAGISGVNEGTLGTFLKAACDIPNYKGGGC